MRMRMRLSALGRRQRTEGRTEDGSLGPRAGRVEDVVELVPDPGDRLVERALALRHVCVSFPVFVRIYARLRRARETDNARRTSSMAR